MGQAKNRGNFEQRVAAVWEEHGVKPLTEERYNAFIAWTRSPIAGRVATELEFFATKDERLIGMILIDHTDRDFGFVALGRDEKGRYRAIDVQASLTKTEARHLLFKSLQRLGREGAVVYPQGDADDDDAGLDLFSPLVPPEKLHPSFKLLSEHVQWIPARSIMSEMMRHFTDVDGNFVEQFQTTAFDSRIWELYLYASLLELGLFVEKPKPAPDFMVSSGRNKVFIEAVTVGPSSKDPAPLPDDEPRMRSPDEIKELLKGKIPIRFGSSLYSKLTRKNPYWEMEGVKNQPLVFAIADFHEKHSMTWTSPALLQYLYGVSHDFIHDENGQLIITPMKLEMHEYDGKEIPSGFFLQENAENISAVLFTSSGTISKFNRMGKLAGFGVEHQRLYRMGVRHNHDPNASLPLSFMHEVKHGIVKETWAEGLSMFHNPKAKHPLDVGMFPGIAHHFIEEGRIKSLLPEFHPYSSFTWNMLLTDAESSGCN